MKRNFQICPGNDICSRGRGNGVLRLIKTNSSPPSTPSPPPPKPQTSPPTLGGDRPAALDLKCPRVDFSQNHGQLPPQLFCPSRPWRVSSPTGDDLECGSPDRPPLALLSPSSQGVLLRAWSHALS